MDVEEPDPLVGRDIDGRYHVLRRLGRGGMGTVYVASQTALGREVALKFVSPGRVDAETIARFKKEALAVGQLVHPNIVSVHDFGVTGDGLMYLAMELLAGKSLQALLEERRALDWRETLPILEDVTRGLAVAHERGIIHRDLKPANVMVVDVRGGRPFAKILDFGVAKLVGAQGGNVTQTGIVVGTPGYIAPEHVHGITEDPRSDFYSLGVMWFEMLAGCPPFSGETPMKVVLRHLQEQAPSVLQYKPDIPANVESLLTRLLAKQPEERPANGEALLAELAAIARGDEAPPVATARMYSAAPPPSSSTPALPTPQTGSAPAASMAVPPAARPSRRGLVALAAAGALVVLLVVGGLLAWLAATGDTPAAEPAAVPVSGAAAAGEVAREAPPGDGEETAAEAEGDDEGAAPARAAASDDPKPPRKASRSTTKKKSSASSAADDDESSASGSSTSGTSTKKKRKKRKHLGHEINRVLKSL